MKNTNGRRAPLHERVAALQTTLSPSERAVALFLTDHLDLVAVASAVELGERTKTSNATVIRTVKSLGYAGLPELKRTLFEEVADSRNPMTVLGQRINRIDAEDSGADQVLLATADLLQRTRRLLDPVAWRAAVDILDTAGSVLCYGIEEAGCVADFLAISLTRCGKQTRSMTATGIGIANGLLTLTQKDAVVVIATLRHFREIDVILDRARAVGSPIVLITESLGLALGDRVDAVLTTAQSTLDATSGVLAAMTFASALVLELSAHNPDRSVDALELLTQLRYQSAGTELDMIASPHLVNLGSGPTTQL